MNIEQISVFSLWLATIISIRFVLCYLFKDHTILKQSVYITILWVCGALLYTLYIYKDGSQKSLEFLTGYIVELSLSIDNIFIFILIFQYFKLDTKQQIYLLTWGVWGAVVMRICMILFGTYLISQFSWLLYVFGVILFVSGIKILNHSDQEADFKESWLYRVINKFFTIAKQSNCKSFFIKEKGKIRVTYVFIALIFIEKSDLIFALDSIPAILAITQDKHIIITSNIFAILCLRALYFVISDLLSKLYYIKYALCGILCFIGIKMLLPIFDYHIPIYYSLTFILTAITLAVIMSLAKPMKNN